MSVSRRTLQISNVKVKCSGHTLASLATSSMMMASTPASFCRLYIATSLSAAHKSPHQPVATLHTRCVDTQPVLCTRVLSRCTHPLWAAWLSSMLLVMEPEKLL